MEGINKEMIHQFNSFYKHLIEQFLYELDSLDRNENYLDTGEIIEFCSLVFPDLIDDKSIEYLERLINTFEYRKKNIYRYWLPVSSLKCALFALKNNVQTIEPVLPNLANAKSSCRGWIQSYISYVIKYIDYDLLLPSLYKNIEYHHFGVESHLILIFFAKGEYWEKVHFLRYILCKYKNNFAIESLVKEIKFNPKSVNNSKFSTFFKEIYVKLQSQLNSEDNLSSELKEYIITEISEFIQAHPLSSETIDLSILDLKV